MKAMEAKDKLDQIHLAINQLMEEKRNKKASDDSFVSDDQDHHLLSTLLSQLESLKGGGTLRQPEPSTEPKKAPSPVDGEVITEIETVDVVDRSNIKIGTEEIVKELREVKRQNSITHCLLSIMIVLTLAWQLSEVSLILKVKNGLSNPFKSFGSVLTGMLKGPGINDQDGKKKSSTSKQPHSEAPSVPLKIPELPHVDIPMLGVNDED